MRLRQRRQGRVEGGGPKVYICKDWSLKRVAKIINSPGVEIISRKVHHCRWMGGGPS